MEKQYTIVDATANTGREYIAESGENTSLEENAIKFQTRQEAEKHLELIGGQEWGKVIEL